MRVFVSIAELIFLTSKGRALYIAVQSVSSVFMILCRSGVGLLVNWRLDSMKESG